MTALRSVLYVDDEPDIREIAALALGLDGTLDVRTPRRRPSRDFRHPTSSSWTS